MALRDLFEFSSLRRTRALPAVLALVIAGFAWFGAQSVFLSGASEPAPPPAAPPVSERQIAATDEQPAVQPAEGTPVYPSVLVAAVDIRPGIMLTSKLVEWTEWEGPIDLNLAVLRDAVPLSAVLGSVTRRRLMAGTPIGWDGLMTPGVPGFIGAVLAPGMRAVTVEVDRATTSANIIYPGDRVDVIMVVAQDGAEPVAQAIVRDVRVLAVGSTTFSLGRYGTASMVKAGAIEAVERPEGENYTLELLPTDAERVALAVNTGRLTLAMRSVNATPSYRHGGDRGPVRLGEVLVDPNPPAPVEAPEVRIIRGTEDSTVVAES